MSANFIPMFEVGRNRVIRNISTEPMGQLIIAYVHKGYPEKRNIINTCSTQVDYIRAIDVFKLLSHIVFRVFNRSNPILLNLFFSPWKMKCDVLHLFNGVNLGVTPWVSTFETSLPRLGRVPDWINIIGVRRLADKSCIRLIAISECARRMQQEHITEKFSHYSEAISKKTIVLHPPQPILIGSLSEKPNYRDGIVFVFVGNQFFSKGGREVLKLFMSDKIREKKFTLHIISSIQSDTYASHTTLADTHRLKQQILNLPKNIEFHGVLENNSVIDILRNSHVALLPTYADTYGYFVLEAQACGCPVISTDIRALSEINNSECGWVISTPKDSQGNGRLSNADERTKFSECVYKGLEKYVMHIFDNTSSITVRSFASIKRIKEQHDPHQHAIALENIYTGNYVGSQ